MVGMRSIPYAKPRPPRATCLISIEFKWGLTPRLSRFCTLLKKLPLEAVQSHLPDSAGFSFVSAARPILPSSLFHIRGNLPFREILMQGSGGLDGLPPGDLSPTDFFPVFFASPGEYSSVSLNVISQINGVRNTHLSLPLRPNWSEPVFITLGQMKTLLASAGVKPCRPLQDPNKNSLRLTNHINLGLLKRNLAKFGAQLQTVHALP